MKRTLSKVMLLALLSLVVRGDGCVLKEKVFDVVINESFCVDWNEDHESATWGTPEIIDYAKKIDEILAERGLSRSDIKSASVKGGTYTVLKCKPPVDHSDWVIGGKVTVKRNDPGVADGPVDILAYTSQSVKGAVGVVIVADLTTAGIDLLNRALDDYLNPDGTGDNPVLEFATANESVDPVPDSSDPIVFTWRGCMDFQIVLEENVKVPDPW